MAWRFHARKYGISKHENDILINGNDIFMHENDSYAPGMIYFARNIFMGNYAVHSFIHRILIHENSWAKFSFSCIGNFIFMHGNFIFMNGNEILMFFVIFFYLSYSFVLYFKV